MGLRPHGLDQRRSEVGQGAGPGPGGGSRAAARLPFTEAAAISHDPIGPLPSHSSGAWLADLSDETAET
jgi:hypothetical protein